jgi:hypothetical protein
MKNWTDARAEEVAARRAYDEHAAADAPNPRDFPNGKGWYDADAHSAALAAWAARGQELRRQWEAASQVRREAPRNA